MTPPRHKTARETDREGVERGPNGRRLCRWCKTEVPKGLRTFCGKKECVHEWNIRSNSNYARLTVWQRDNGVCAVCGLDTEALLLRLKIYIKNGVKPIPDDDRYIWRFPDSLKMQVLGKDAGRSSLWDMDHIIPVSEGGGSCGLENLRTLCVWCHRRATKLLKKRLSKVPIKGRGKEKRLKAKAKREEWLDIKQRRNSEDDGRDGVPASIRDHGK